MPVQTGAVGKSFPAVVYAVGREKVREYAAAVGETNPLYLDVRAAREAGFADVVAPPMFAVVYSAPAMAPAIFDAEVAMDFARMVHGGQELRWGELVVAGDEVTTTVTLQEIRDEGARAFYVFRSESVNSDGAETCVGTWTNIVRGA